MPLPDTFVGLQEAGYKHYSAWRCPSCGRHVEIFLTPRCKKMGFVLKKDSETSYEPHAAVCPMLKRKPA
jgi:predicted RNA-binding Zn-ribbon protein involved in translation (DUF1610 family)